MTYHRKECCCGEFKEKVVHQITRPMIPEVVCANCGRPKPNDVDTKTLAPCKARFSDVPSTPFGGLAMNPFKTGDRVCLRSPRGEVMRVDGDQCEVELDTYPDVQVVDHKDLRKIETCCDKNVEAVRQMLLERSQVGLKKYGTTTERNDLELRDWLQHALEEVLDQAVYLRAALNKLN